MQNSWLSPHRPFDVAAFLKRIKSPRLQDMPNLPAWIDEAARQYDLRAEWLCGLAQKEQSALTKGTLSQHGRDWLCGFGYTEGPVYSQFRGERNQVFSAAKGLRRYMTPGDSLYCGNRVGKSWRDLDGQTGKIGSLVEACALQYTPHWSTLATCEDLWRYFRFEDGGESMARLAPPLRIGPNGFGIRYNNTLHGRSIYRSRDVPGHNVFKGYSTWTSNGRRGVGDGLDCFGPARTPVYAMHDGVQTVWRNDTQKLEVIYVEGGGITTVYAHIDATHEATGVRIKRGDLVGYMRGDLNDPHLHLEVWVDGKAVAASSASALAKKLIALADAPSPPTTVGPARSVVVLPGYENTMVPRLIDGEHMVTVRDVAKAFGRRLVDNRKIDGKLYFEETQP